MNHRKDRLMHCEKSSIESSGTFCSITTIKAILFSSLE